jgi:phage baseplate assembly protein W
MASTIYPIAPGSGSSDPGFVGVQGISQGQFNQIFGFGLIVPFRRGANDFVSSGGEEFVKSMVSQTLGTVCDSDFTQGEVPWRTEFGSLINFIRHKNNSEVAAELTRVYVIDALTRWVPQIRIKNVIVEKKKDLNGHQTILLAVLHYDIIEIRRPGNDVLISNVSQSLELLQLAA